MHNPLIFIDACLWSFLHFLVLNIPPSRLPVFPVLAGLVWLVTLSTLLLSWVAHGMPHYPGQEHPIAFVSLAGAWYRGLLVVVIGGEGWLTMDKDLSRISHRLN